MGASVMNFDNIIGQVPIVKWCKAALENDTIPNVTLFVGPSGIGKSSTAKILACEIAANGDAEFCGDLKDKIIKQNIEKYECVHIYNMSNLDQTAVLQVREDLTTAFSKTGRKVIIMDEAHGMKDEAQDTLLTAFESLPKGVHVIICTTDRSKLRPALLSRCYPRYFGKLTTKEMERLIAVRLEEKSIKILANEQIVVNYFISYAGHDARAVNNIIDNIPAGSQMSMDSLEMYVPIFEPKAVLQLIKYLYGGNIIAGLNLIPDLTLGDTFHDILIDILRTAMGDTTRHFTRQDSAYIVDLCSNDISRLSGFVIDCGKQHLTVPRLSAIFLYWNVGRPPGPKSADEESILIEDIKNLEVKPVDVNVQSTIGGTPIYEDFEAFLQNTMIVGNK